MNIKTISEIMADNNSYIQELDILIKRLDPEVPDLENYDDDGYTAYLADQEIYPSDSDFDTYFDQIKNSYQKRQDYQNDREYYLTLNTILNSMITFYLENLRDPYPTELSALAEGSGTKDNIEKAIDYINDNVL